MDVDASKILFRQSPRNLGLAAELANCGLVERSGLGADRMFKAAIEEGNPLAPARISILRNKEKWKVAFPEEPERAHAKRHRLSAR